MIDDDGSGWLDDRWLEMLKGRSMLVRDDGVPALGLKG